MKQNVGVFFGGRSVEHEISIISALQVIKAMDKNKYTVTPIYITRDGIWYTGNWLLYIDNFKDYKSLIKNSKKIIPSLNSNDGSILSYPSGIFKSSSLITKLDIAFPVFHGTYGEDGSFQGVFEIMNIPYVGSNVVSSAICMNKSFTKEISKALEIPTIEYYTLDSDSWFKEKEYHLTKISDILSYPIIIKPNDLGSSIAVSKASNKEELISGIELASLYSNNILIEKCISKIKEVNCSVIETTNGIELSECEEPLNFGHDLLGFNEKYLSSSTTNEGMAGSKRKIPATLTETQKINIKKYSESIFSHLGCSGVVRIDFIIDESNDSLYLNEINTIPGSLAFYLWEATNKTFVTLTSELIENAIKRFSKKNKVRKNFPSNVLFNIDGSKLSNKLM